MIYSLRSMAVFSGRSAVASVHEEPQAVKFLSICSENALHIGGFYFSQAASVPAACYSS